MAKISADVKAALKRKAVKGDIKSPDLACLVSHFFDHAGGERAVAKMLYDEFSEAKQGSIVRQRILDLILRSTKYANEQAPPVDDLGLLTEADLEAEFEHLVDEIGSLDEREEQEDSQASAGAPAEN